MEETEDIRKNPDEQQAEKIANAIIEDKPVADIPSRLVPKIYSCLQIYKVERVQENDFINAQLIEDKAQDLLQTNLEAIYESNLEASKTQLEKKLKATKIQYKTSHQKNEIVFQKILEKRDEAFQVLQEANEKEMKEFNEEYRDENILPAFKKFSGRFYDIKKKIDSMVSSRRYVEADQMRKELNILQKKEEQIQMNKWHENVETKRQIKVREQQNKITFLQNKWDNIMSEFQRRAQSDEEKLEKSILATENRLESFETNPIRKDPVDASSSRAMKTRMRTQNYIYQRNKEMNKVQKSKLHSSKPLFLKPE